MTMTCTVNSLRFIATVWIGSLFLALMSGCRGDSVSTESLPNETSKVITSNYPLWFFAERLGGDEIEVELPVPTSINPSFWRPDAEDVQEMQRAKLVVLNGAGFEHWLPSVTLSTRKLVKTAEPFRAQWIQIETEVTHNHGPEGEHSHTGWADHTWLAPELASEQLRSLSLSMAKAFPNQAAEIEGREKELQVSLSQLSESMTRRLGGYAGQTVLASHPVYQYLGRQLGVELESLEWEPGTTPDASQRESFEQLLERHPASVMLWQAEPTPSTRDYLETHGVKVVVFETCGNRPPEGDLLTKMQSGIDRLAKALETSP